MKLERTMTPHYLSLGVGVQSSTFAFMCDEGEIQPMPRAAFFSDTKDEPKKVYRQLEYLRANIKNFPIYDASKGDLMEESLRIRRSARSGKLYLAVTVPVFIKNPDGSKGVLQRKCTRDYKIHIVERMIRKHLGIKRVPRNTGIIARVYMGISFDELDRVTPSVVPWIEKDYRLVEMGMTRQDCIDWMIAHDKPEPPRSACKKCPYHSDATWLRQKNEEPEEFAESVEWERRLQAAFGQQEVLKGMPFLHDSLVPLDEVIFDATKQRDNFGRTCEGMCGV